MTRETGPASGRSPVSSTRGAVAVLATGLVLLLSLRLVQGFYANLRYEKQYLGWRADRAGTASGLSWTRAGLGALLWLTIVPLTLYRFTVGKIAPGLEPWVAYFCVLFGIPLGIWFGKSQRAYNAALPVLDFMQTMPAFVYLIPIIAFFGTGKPPGVGEGTGVGIGKCVNGRGMLKGCARWPRQRRAAGRPDGARSISNGCARRSRRPEEADGREGGKDRAGSLRREIDPIRASHYRDSS